MDSDFKKIREIVSNSASKISLHLGHWNAGGQIKTVSPSIGDNLKEQLRKLVLDQLETRIKESPSIPSEYNIVGANDGVIEQANCTKNYQDNMGAILASLAQPTISYRFSSDKFDFFIYQFSLENNSNKVEKNDKTQSVYAFRRIKHVNFLKKGIWGRLEDGKFNSISEDTKIGTDDLLDFIYFENIAYIFEHISFERILKLSNQFVTVAQTILNNKEMAKKIKNFNK
ncbi:MAG: hypothetical protein ABF808_06610, partial [Oenococcus sp.]